MNGSTGIFPSSHLKDLPLRRIWTRGRRRETKLEHKRDHPLTRVMHKMPVAILTRAHQNITLQLPTSRILYKRVIKYTQDSLQISDRAVDGKNYGKNYTKSDN